MCDIEDGSPLCVPVFQSELTEWQTARMHNTIPGHWNRVAYYSQHWFELIRKLGSARFQRRLGTLLWKAQERHDANPFCSPACVFVRLCGVSLAEGGVGQLALRQCLCWWGERERERERGRGGACRILCVSSLHVRDIAERKCITGRCPRAPLHSPLYSPFPFLVYLPLLSLSTENTEAL